MVCSDYFLWLTFCKYDAIMKLLHPNEANGWAKSSFWHEINEVKLYKALSIYEKWMQNPLYQDVMYRLVVDNQILGLLTPKTHFLVLLFFFFKKKNDV